MCLSFYTFYKFYAKTERFGYVKREITYGIFDLLHSWHINLLKKAEEQGDCLIVTLSADEFNKNEKNKVCYYDCEKRKKLLEAISYVDLVMLEERWEQKRIDVSWI